MFHPALIVASAAAALLLRPRGTRAPADDVGGKPGDVGGGGVDVSASASAAVPTLGALPPPTPPPSLPGPPATLTTLDLSRRDLTCLDALFPACPPKKPLYPRLEALDVSHNALTHLPAGLATAAPRLARLNLQGTRHLASLPSCIGDLARLNLLGASQCGLTALPDSLGRCGRLEQLYVTANALTALPASLASCARLQKVQASFNPGLVDLGGLATGALPALEMLRVACCGLRAFPPSLARAPRLCWVSLANNPAAASAPPPSTPATAVVPARDVTPGPYLGAGASGDVCVATLRPRGDLPATAALKTFRGDTGPDGRAADEVSISRAVAHPALSRVLAIVRGKKRGGRAAPPPALLLELVRGTPLADRPTGKPLLRPHWRGGGERLDPVRALRVGAALAGGLAHLHAKGLAHGDFYAHNVLLCQSDEASAGGGGQAPQPPSSPAVLVDFGAAFAYSTTPTPSAFPPWAFQAFEARALGLFLGELERHALTRQVGAAGRWCASRALVRASKACLAADPSARPPLASVERELLAVADKL